MPPAGRRCWLLDAQFLHMVLPAIAPTVLLVAAVITVSGYFQLFAEPYVATRGDPLQSTVTVLYFMFRRKASPGGRSAPARRDRVPAVPGHPAATTLLLRLAAGAGMSRASAASSVDTFAVNAALAGGRGADAAGCGCSR